MESSVSPCGKAPDIRLPWHGSFGTGSWRTLWWEKRANLKHCDMSKEDYIIFTEGLWQGNKLFYHPYYAPYGNM
jgi:hypothetical protein